MFDYRFAQYAAHHTLCLSTLFFKFPCFSSLLCQALSLELQSPAPASLSSALSWLSAAVKGGLAAARKHPGAFDNLTSCLLHIPTADVQQLKVCNATLKKLAGMKQYVYIYIYHTIS